MWMLAVPCMPVNDAAGNVIGIPRWEYWIIHVSVPSNIWWRWTGGLQPIEILDRLPIMGTAAAWLGLSWAIGRLVARSRGTPALSPVLSHLVGTLAGHTLLGSWIFVHGWLFGCKSYWTLVLLGCGMLWLISLNGERKTPLPENSKPPADFSLSSSMRRRLVGLLLVTNVGLACIQVYGASIPTADRDLRANDWWLVKHVWEDGSLRYRDDHILSNAPSLNAMTGLGITSVLELFHAIRVADGASEMADHARQTDRYYHAVLATKVIYSVLVVLGIAIAGLFLSQRYGLLPGLMATFCLLATPGIAELVRLGRTDVMPGVFGIAWMVCMQSHVTTQRSHRLWDVMSMCLVAGSLASGYLGLLFVGIPTAVFALMEYFRNRERPTDAGAVPSIRMFHRQLATITSLLVLVLGSIPYLRNAISTGDPIAPWSMAVLQQWRIVPPTEPIQRLHQSLHAWKEVESHVWAVDESQVVSNVKTNQSWSGAWSLLHRLVWASNAHGLLMVPLTVLGLGVWLKHRPQSNLGQIAGWMFYWLAAWWMVTPGWDRDCLGVCFLASWFVAFGGNWYLGERRALGLVLVAFIALVWSVVVIPIWPTSDQRILVGIQSMRNKDRWQLVEENHAIGRSTARTKMLLIGDRDDFDEKVMCLGQGEYEPSLWDQIDAGSAAAREELLRDHQITHLYVQWQSVRERDFLKNGETEVKVRRVLGEMQAEGQIQLVGSGNSPSPGDLFRVITD
jgi:hypothetical protein